MAQTLEQVIDALEALVRSGRLDEAVDRYHAALQQWPGHPALLYNLGTVQLRRQDWTAAQACFSRVTSLAPQFAWAHHNLGQALLGLKRKVEAKQPLHQALQLDPRLRASRIALARLIVDEGRPAAAAELLQAGLSLEPEASELLVEIGNARRAQGQTDQALAAYQRALALLPTSFAARHNLGATLHALGRTDDALPFVLQAVDVRPDSAPTQETLGDVLAHLGDLKGARAAYDRAVRLKPATVFGSVGLELRRALMLPPVAASTAEIDECRTGLARAIAELSLHPGSLIDPIAEVGSSGQFYLAFHGRNNRQLLADLSAMYRTLCPALDFTAAHCEDRQPLGSRRIRIGIVSKYLRAHTVGRYLIGLVRHLSRCDFEVCLFTWEQPEDALAQEFRTLADRFDTLPRSLQAMQKQLAAAEVDVLIYGDVGMEPASYFLSFSRLAPVQCAFFGHPDTTGVDTVDHFISWSIAESAGPSDWYVEKPALLSASVCYANIAKPIWGGRAADRSSLGWPDGAPVYLCVQSPYKLHPDFDNLLAGILDRDGLGRVVLVEGPIKAWNEALRRRLAARLGPSMARLSFVPARSYADYMAMLAAADVVLDTPHFSGGATTLDAIAVSAPVVTLSGPTLRSAQSSALFRRAGVTDGIASSAEDYVRRAVAIATDREQAADIRRRLMLDGQRVFDDTGMVREMEAMMRDWVDAASADSA